MHTHMQMDKLFCTYRKKSAAISVTYMLVILLSIVTVSLAISCDSIPDDSGTAQCQQILNSRCHRFGYNTTSFPNVFNHTNQNAAEKLLAHIGSAAVGSDCSIYFEPFLCSAIYPICTNHFKRIEPCRELCMAVRESCGQTLRDNNYNWDEDLDCNQFPSSESSICVWTRGNPCEAIVDSHSPSVSEHTPTVMPTLKCSGHLVVTENSNLSRFGSLGNCSESCDGVFFENDQQALLQVWIMCWSLATLIVSILIFLTCILNFRRLSGLESPIYYIALCYLFLSLTYTISIAVGKETLICEPNFKNSFNESSLLFDATNHPLCLVIFCVVYYFTLCTWSWWVIYTMQWLLCSIRNTAANYKWRLCFHMVAWGTPLVFTLTTLSLKHVTGDAVMRTCWIEKHREIEFLVFPLFLSVLICSVVLVVCFSRVVKLQRSQKQNTTPGDNVRPVTLIRVGLYLTVYLVPMGILLCIYFYEYWYRREWEINFVNCLTLPSSSCEDNSRPVLGVFLVKTTASLSMGIISIFWVIGRESLLVWRKVCCFCWLFPSPPPDVRIGQEFTVNSSFTATKFHIHNFGDGPSHCLSSESSA